MSFHPDTPQEGAVSTGRRLASLALFSLAALLLAAAPAQAAFGLNDLDVTFTGPPPAGAEPADLGPVVSQAGTHPYAMTTSFGVNGEETAEGGYFPDEAVRDALFTLMEGFAASPTAVPACSAVDFLTVTTEAGQRRSSCPNSAAVGIVANQLASKNSQAIGYAAVYNLEPSPGYAGKLGFWFSSVPVTIDARLSEDPPYRVIAGPTNISQLVEVAGSDFTLWGVPVDPRHDFARGRCLGPAGDSLGECPVSIDEKPFITMPRACEGPLASTYFARSWLGSTDTGAALTHDDSGNPQGMIGCGALGFAPSIEAAPTSRAAQSPTGLDFSLALTDEGITSPKEGAISGSDVEEAVVTLPEGMTINPSQAEGLEVCTEAQLDRETSQSGPGEGCPQASKVGTIEVETPLLDGTVLEGSLYVAEPYANLAGDSLIAVYVVIKDRELGIDVVQPLRVEPDPQTGRLVTYSEDMPQVPFSEFRLRFKEGGRSPLVTPPACGSHEVEAVLTPRSGGPAVESTSSFEILSGPDNGPCPAAGTPPFEPGFSGGTLNNAAGKFSPFLLRLTRRDGDQDLVRFDAALPPGALAKLAGVEKCSDAAIAQIATKTGKAELASPSCPANSRIGSVRAGAGVGSQLTYVPGSVYLAGPFGGAPLSVVGVVPAVAGPFDVGVVSTRQALTVDPVTGEAKVDGSLSQPIPHILAGIPLSVRDIQVSVDRPEFTLNPTNCSPLSFAAAIWGGGANPFSLLDDSPVGRSARFQAADCAALGFKPRLAINLRGGTKRGAHPALRAVVTPRPGDANFSHASVTLPRSAFLDQAHIRTICTRVQFAAGAGHGSQCPKGAQYGFARAWSPLLEEPLVGPVFLRSSDNNLPDLVVALKGLVEIELSSRIDSVKGGIRSTFTGIPDAPVSRFVLEMQGGETGLIVNSRDLCHKRSRAKANLRGQNGKFSRTRPVVRAVKCGKPRNGKRG